MRKSEIKIGHCYLDKSGKRVRKVVDMGPQYKLYDEVQATDGLLYEIIQDGSKKNRTKGEQHNMTLTAFASWAKKEYVE